ncbi:fibronectin type III domain-containing protein [Nocardioides ferulae]|uniref:fibronectin type III domain-containing protein n=1 Tax=Nocardioides ferulae TaxID=2340821 RepID=UPI000EB45511|nr:fibronectin type III domain-containing protein [Nocardioides ferulae]
MPEPRSQHRRPRHPSRRPLLLFAVLLTLTVPLLTAGPGAQAGDGRRDARAPRLDPVRARPADDLVDAFGVQTHLAYPGTPYQDVAKVRQALTGLGVRHVRDQLYVGRPALYAAMRTIAGSGVRFNLIMGNPISWETPELLVRTLAEHVPHGVVESLEGANEWNLKGRSGWARELRQHQAALRAAAAADPATADLPLLAPALGMRTGFQALGDLTGSADLNNVHIYPGGRSPATWIAELLALALRHVLPEAPVMVTEGGYHNAMNTTSGHHPTPERVVGVYAPRMLLEHFRRGTERFYMYELVDEGPEPALVDPEAHFGLVRSDFTPKPAYRALRHLLQLAEDPGPAIRPGTLAYEVEDAPLDLHQVLLQRRDGDFVLLLWRDVSVYDRVSERGLRVEPAPVTVQLDRRRTVAVHRPSRSGDAVASVHGSQVPVSLTGDVVALRISGDGPAPSLPSRPRRVRAHLDDGDAVVSWRAPRLRGASRIRHYRVVRHPGGEAVTLGRRARSVRIPVPPRATQLRFAVRARNATGLGRASFAEPLGADRPAGR